RAVGPRAPGARPNGRDRGPVEGGRGNRGVPPATHATELEERLAEAEARAEEYLATAQRVAADFENYRKRAARDQESLVARAHERLLKALIPILDDLERALEAANEHEEAKLEEGVALVHRSLADLLAREGLAEIRPAGAFDP